MLETVIILANYGYYSIIKKEMPNFALLKKLITIKRIYI